jgi:hypothetical protein
MTYSDSTQLVRADELPDGRIIVWWNESDCIVFHDDAALQEYCQSITPRIKDLLRALLIMDYSEQRVDGKTASLSISDPDDIWVVAS